MYQSTFKRMNAKRLYSVSSGEGNLEEGEKATPLLQKIFKEMKPQFFLTIFILLIALVDSIAQPQVEAQIDRNRMLIGDQIKLLVRISNYEGFSYDYPNYDVINKEGVEVVKISKPDSIVLSNGLQVIDQELFVTSFDSGSHWIQPINFSFTNATNNIVRTTNRIPFEVGNVQVVDSMGLAPIKTILLEEASFWDKYKTVILALGVLLLVGLLIFGMRFFKFTKEKLAVKKPIIPAHELALQKLSALKEKKLWQQGNVKEYQSELTYIVREYLEGRYNVQALESTTSQINHQLKAMSFSDEIKSQLSEMLNLADMVKFAKAEPPVEYHEKLMGYAENFVVKTKPVIVEKEEVSN